MDMKESFEQAQSRVRRVLEGVGGSSDAYEAPPSAPKQKGRISWDEAVRGLGPKTPVERVAPTSQRISDEELAGSSDEPGEDELNAFIREQLNEPYSLPGVVPSEEMDCGTGLEEFFGIGKPPRPLSDEYQLSGHSSDMGELEAIYMAFALTNTSEEAEVVGLASGPCQMKQVNGNWELYDEAKKLRYLKEDISAHHPEVDPSDTFIWVLPLGQPGASDFGYLHRGWAFVRKD